jgi:micrococcal nuclease
MSHHIIIYLALAAGAFACKRESASLRDFNGKVISIKDGDTIEVLFDYKPMPVRLADIDCPENGQPYSRNAKRFTSDACFGRTVRVTSNGRLDRYGRLIATIIVNDTLNLNEVLVKEGYAWHYKKYSRKQYLSDFEEAARQDRKGLWSDENPMAPWEWRK